MKRYYRFLAVWVVLVTLIVACKKEDATHHQSSTSIPAVTTNAVMSITAGSAVCGGNVTAIGGDTIIARGICIDTSANPTITSQGAYVQVTSIAGSLGNFIDTIYMLTASTTYHVRAYATNSFGTAYGNDISFTTTSGPFVIGQRYGGGIIFYIDNTGSHGFIDGGEAPTVPYMYSQDPNLTITPADTTGVCVGCGAGNTTMLFYNFDGGLSNTTPCAIYDVEYYTDILGPQTGGPGPHYNDWFLPSLDEYELIRQNLFQHGIGTFGYHQYWTSSLQGTITNFYNTTPSGNPAYRGARAF